ncbi:hypothetical protein HPB50_010699 [Hyalomma asiaticum]|uniref:Uncharacterized protein n=1 Tax=Hyalomma asiaticum TaxID=266040 RepID=A0ACB7SDY1_HYAAI|nr:hypothetical protein HPB50_010699 [Hyalomma asiaticum]
MGDVKRGQLTRQTLQLGQALVEAIFTTGAERASGGIYGELLPIVHCSSSSSTSSQHKSRTPTTGTRIRGKLVSVRWNRPSLRARPEDMLGTVHGRCTSPPTSSERPDVEDRRANGTAMRRSAISGKREHCGSALSEIARATEPKGRRLAHFSRSCGGGGQDGVSVREAADDERDGGASNSDDNGEQARS